MSLEVDGRHSNVPILYQRESEDFKQIIGDINYNIPPTAESHDAVDTTCEHAGPPKASKPRNLGLGRRVRVRQGLVFCWGVLFALVSVLAVVAAVMAGSIAARREKQIDTCMKDLDTKLSANASSPTNTSIEVKSTDTANSTCQTSNPPTFISTSDCGSLASPYEPLGRSLTKGKATKSFNLHCGTDFSLDNTELMDFITFTFEDCIAACAVFNQQALTRSGSLTCYIVNFVNLGENGKHSCYLKGIRSIAPILNRTVDSASLITN